MPRRLVAAVFVIALACTSHKPVATPTISPTPTPSASPSPSPSKSPKSSPKPSPSKKPTPTPTPSPSPSPKPAPRLSIDPRHVAVGFATVASGLSSPAAIGAPNDGSGRLFVVEQGGRIRVYVPGSGLRSTPFLDIHTRVLWGGERGLLGLAFHPNYKSNGYFFVYYTDTNGNLQISRFHATPSSNTAGTTETKILNISHPNYANHNGGQLAFRGSYLYIGTGDGGSGGDPSGNAQNLGSLLGKILRIDIDHSCSGHPYCSPASNPFASSSSARHEIWLYGLRNPWRFSFDSSTGAEWIGDVGQDTYEEVDYLGAGTGGRNMGWDCREGTLNTVNQYGGSYCSGRSFTGPTYQYGHSNGRCAIVGGYVYRGSTYKSVMGGLYLYGDYCTGEMWALGRSSSGTWINDFVGQRSASITSFGQSINGEVYVVDTGGTLSRVTARRI